MRIYKVNVLKKILGISIIAPIMLSLSLFGANPVKIMPLGDSITRGNNLTTILTGDENNMIAYRGYLWTKLSAGGYNVDFVGSQKTGSNYTITDPSFDLDHEGHGGYHADDIASSVTGYLTTNPADIVLLHIGTNDLNNSATIQSTVDDVNNTLENIDSGVSTAIKVVVARIINHKTPDQKTTDFNIALEKMLQKRITNGDDITIVDMENSADINYTTDMEDGLHPNATGYEKMANLWYSTLSSLLTSTLPIHLWRLDEDPATTTYLDFYSAADGTCTDPGCPVPVAGQVNGAQSFDGNDKIDVTDTSTFNWAANDSFTIEFWMKTGVDTVNGQNNVMIGRKSVSNGSGLAWFIAADNTNGGRILFGLNDSNDLGGPNNLKGATPVTDDKWHHIVCVRDNDKNENRLYVDGILDGSITATYDVDFNESVEPVKIGYLDWNVGFDYNGTLDEVAVYDTALSTGLILQHNLNGVKPHLAVVTPVSTPTTNITPAFTFSSDKAGTITYGGSCTSAITSATVGDNLITFDAPIGIYSDCTITVTAADGNVSDPLLVPAFTVVAEPDLTAPTLAEVTPVVSPTNDKTPDYTFSSDEAGTITYGGSCTSATTTVTAGDNTITFDTLVDGTYSDCTITVTDAAGNASDPLLVSEFVVDATIPIITLLGNSPIDVEQGSTYSDAGATASDGINGDITGNIVTVNPVDTTTLGEYTITYNVTDSSGNVASQVTRTVNVVDTTVPVITLLGSDPQVIIVGSDYTELNATAQDDVDGDISADIVIDASAVDTTTLGQYTVTYDVTDSSGNAAIQVTRTVNVVDTTVNMTEVSSNGGGCTYNPDSKNFDMTFLLMIALGLFYPFRRRFIK